MVNGATLIQATNVVLLLRDSNSDIRKFIVWRKEDDKLKEVLQKLEITRVAIEDNAKTFEHPIETGAVITDYEIFDPNKASIQAYIANNDRETLTELEYLYQNGIPLKIRAGSKIVENVLIDGKPYEITSDVFDKTLYSITLKGFLEVTPVYLKLDKAKVRNKSNASRVNMGIKQAQPKKKSWLASAIFGGRT